MITEIQVKLVETVGDLDQVRDLFKEYFAWVDTVMGFDMTYQGVATELETLPGAYSLPEGCLLLAVVNGQPAGCVALRPRGPGVCELKRMYVRPQYQGQGLGRALCERVIQEGKDKGYAMMRLDTEKTLERRPAHLPLVRLPGCTALLCRAAGDCRANGLYGAAVALSQLLIPRSHTPSPSKPRAC